MKEIIDFRNRPPAEVFSPFFSDEIVSFINRRLNVETSQAFKEKSLEMWIAEMDEAGITKSVVVGRNIATCLIPNSYIAELIKKYPNRLIGLAGIDPANVIHNALDEIDRTVQEYGLKGINIDPGLSGGNIGIYPTDVRLFPIYEKCSNMGLPVLIMSGPWAGSNMSYSHPCYWDEIAGLFPELTLIAGHGCYPYVTEAIALLYKRPNVYLSPDCYMFTPGGEIYVRALNEFYPDQFLFGSAYPFRPMKETVEDTMKLGIASKVLDKYLYLNTKRIFNL